MEWWLLLDQLDQSVFNGGRVCGEMGTCQFMNSFSSCICRCDAGHVAYMQLTARAVCLLLMSPPHLFHLQKWNKK